MSKGSGRREEDPQKISNNWDQIFGHKKNIEEPYEDLSKVCIMDKTVLEYTFTSCPCVKCNPFTL